MHKYGIITVLPFSKNASPFFAQRKPNRKGRLLVDLKKIKTLIAEDYTNNNHPVRTLSDTAQHLEGKSLLCKLESYQACHCLQMADQRVVEMLLSILQVIKEVAEVLGLTLQHATTKHAQTIGMFERAHASLKKILKIETGERRSVWHKYVKITTPPTTQALDVNPVERSTDVFRIMSWT